MPLGDLGSLALETGLPLLGSYFGPAGALAGGALGQGLSDYFRGPSQYDTALQQLMGQYQQPYQFNPVDFGPIAQEQTRQFQQQTVPGLAERFTSAGGQRSSAFRQQLGQAGSDLASRLAALQAEHNVGQQQAGMQNQGLNLQRMSGLMGLLQGQQQNQQYNRGMRNQQIGNFANILQQGGFQKDLLQQLKAQSAQQRHGQQLSGYQGFANTATGQPTSDYVQHGRQPGALETALGPVLQYLGYRAGSQ